MPEATIAIADASLRQESAQAIIRLAYRQVFGNAPLMEEHRSATAQSLYVTGAHNAQRPVTPLSLSDT